MHLYIISYYLLRIAMLDLPSNWELSEELCALGASSPVTRPSTTGMSEMSKERWLNHWLRCGASHTKSASCGESRRRFLVGSSSCSKVGGQRFRGKHGDTATKMGVEESSNDEQACLTLRALSSKDRRRLTGRLKQFDAFLCVGYKRD